MKRWIVLIVLLLPQAGRGEPASRPAPSSTPARGAEYRFDALRVDGRLHGPEALTVRAMTGGRGAPLLRLRRSFVHRIFETLEDACLHPPSR